MRYFLVICAILAVVVFVVAQPESQMTIWGTVDTNTTLVGYILISLYILIGIVEAVSVSSKLKSNK